MASMNENAYLYEQKLTYDALASPYACLTHPWWVRTPHQLYYPRHRCYLEPLICGERVFGQIAADLKKAKHSLDIITWGFDPGMVLVRGASADDGQRYGDLLKEISSDARHPITVRILVWHDDIGSANSMKNNAGYYGKRFPAIGCSSNGYHSKTHQDYNAEWYEQVCAGAFPNICLHIRSVPSSLLDNSLRGEEVYEVGGAGAVAKRYATHHQKMVLIDYEAPDSAVGYVMGHNSVTDFWDTEAHLFCDPRRETFYHENPDLALQQGPTAVRLVNGRYVGWGHEPNEYEIKAKQRAAQDYLNKIAYVTKPYQDVSLRVRGPILYDLNHNFCEAWSESQPPSVKFSALNWLAGRLEKSVDPLARATGSKLSGKLQEQVAKEPDSGFIPRRAKIKANTFIDWSWQHSAQLLRTQPLHGEKAIKECYANLTRQVQHYIFIQNQYIQYETWATHLKECVQRLRNGGYMAPIYVFILTSTPEKEGMDLPTYSVAQHIGQSQAMVVEHREAMEKAKQGKGQMPITPEKLAKSGINAVMASLWTCANKKQLTEQEYEEIYIHAKVAIVDDAAFTIGSANLNLRSMAIDSELNVLSQAMDAAYELRMALFGQCADGNVGPKQFGDMAGVLGKWQEVMKKNANAMKNGEILKGQLMPFHVDRKPAPPLI